MKQIKSTLASFVVAFGALFAHGAIEEVDGIKWWYKTCDGGVEISSGLSAAAIDTETAGDVAVPSVLGGLPVVAIGDCAFYNCARLTTVTIPSGVTSIGWRAFSNCSRLFSVAIPEGVLTIATEAFYSCTITSVEIPASVTNIGNSAFSYCGALRQLFVDEDNPNYIVRGGLLLTKDGKLLVRGTGDEVSIPNGVEIIGDDAFSGCYNLMNVVIPASVTNIGAYAFSGCGLRAVDIPTSVMSLGEAAFYLCDELTSVNIHEGVTEIGNDAFSRCGLTSIDIPSSVASIGNYAFSYSGLASVDIPKTVLYLGESAFEGCDKLVSVDIPSTLTNLKDYTFLSCVALTNVTIHAGVTSIGEGAFSSCSALMTVTIPSTVTNIGVQAFVDCTSLKDLILSEGVNVIGEWAFSGCVGLESVTIPGTVKDIGDGAFYACGAKIEGLFSTGVTNIGERAFAECGGITKVTIPPSVENVGYAAFSDCTGIVSVIIQEGVTKIGDYVFESCSGLQSVVIPSSVIEMGSSPFCDCYPQEIVAPGWALCELDRSEVTNAVITSGTTTIEDDAFENSRSLISVLIPEGVTHIGEYAFAGCEKLFKLTLPSTVTSIAGSAFAECPSLGDEVVIVDSCVLCVNGECPANVVLPEGVRLIADGAFAECDEIQSVTIPSGVCDIPACAFSNCSGLRSITIPNGVTNIGAYAFSECTNLQTVTIPYGVERIGYGAFDGCSGLKSVSIPTSVECIDDAAFYGCEALEAVSVPNSVRSIGNRAFMECLSLERFCFIGDAPELGEDVFKDASDFSIYVNANSVGWPENGSCQERTIIYGLPNGYYLEKVGEYEWSFAIACDKSYVERGGFWCCCGFGQGMNLEHTDCAVIPSPKGVLLIPDTLGGCPVVSIGNDAFALCTNLTSVTIPQSVSAIEDGAFLGCSGLGDGIVVADGCALCINGRCPENVVFPAETRLIGDGIFRYCSNMKTLVIPEGVTEIGWNAFAGCSGLESVSIPASVTDIEEEAFVGCSGIKRVTVSESNTEYKSQNGMLLTKDGATLVRGINGRVTIPEGVTCVADYAFMGCSGLTAVTIPYGVTSIGWGAFSGCGGLTSIDLPSSVTDVDDSAFTGCNGLKTISVGQANAVYEAIGGLLLTKGGGTLVLAVPSSMTIPSSVTNIFDGALHGCNKLTVAQTNPAYKSLNGLLLTKDGKTLVRGVNGRVTIPEGVTSIADDAFMGCTGLTSVTIPYGVTSIGWGAFSGCNQLKSIEIPATVTDIGIGAFSGCSSLEIVVSKENQEYRSDNGMLLSADGETLFRGVNRRTAVPDGVTTIYDYAFVGCSDMTFLTLPSSVTDVYEDVFAGCNEGLVVNVPSDCALEVLRELLRCRINVQTGSSSVPSYEIIVGRACSIDVGFKGYTVKGLPTGLKYDSKKGFVTGTVKKETGDATVIFTKSGETDVEMLFVVRKESNPTVTCEGLDGTTLTLGVTGGLTGIPLDLGAESGVKSVTATKLPTGMKLASSKDKTSWYITGAPTKAGTYEVAITLTTAAGNKVTEKFSVTVAALPSGATGTFNGFVMKSVGGEGAAETGETLNYGTVQVTVSDVGKITAKVVAAAGAYSFTATGWDSVHEGVYSIEMMTKKGDVLTLRCDSTAAWNAHQVTGSFAAKGATALAVEAQKNAFGKQWFFNATGDEANGWTLSFVENAKSAALTVTLNADGKTSVAGKLGAYKITASGYTDVGGIGTGAIFADFAPVISIKSGKTTIKKVLSLRANLWFDKTNDHEQGVGSAVFVP